MNNLDKSIDWEVFGICMIFLCFINDRWICNGFVTFFSIPRIYPLSTWWMWKENKTTEENFSIPSSAFFSSSSSVFFLASFSFHLIISFHFQISSSISRDEHTKIPREDAGQKHSRFFFVDRSVSMVSKEFLFFSSLSLSLPLSGFFFSSTIEVSPIETRHCILIIWWG